MNYFGIQLIDPHLLIFPSTQRPFSLHSFPLNPTELILLILEGLAQLLACVEISLPTPFSSINNPSTLIFFRTLINLYYTWLYKKKYFMLHDGRWLSLLHFSKPSPTPKPQPQVHSTLGAQTMFIEGVIHDTDWKISSTWPSNSILLLATVISTFTKEERVIFTTPLHAN